MRRFSNPLAIALTCALVIASVLDAQTPAYTTIDFPGSTATMAWGINDRGDVVGVYTLPDTTSHGFLWSGGQWTSVDFPGASKTSTYGINSQGDIAGSYTINGVGHGFVLTQGRFVTVDVPGEPVSGLAAINNNGELVATYNLADNTTHTALIAGDVIQKFDYPNATVTLGNGINDAGDLVANYQIAGMTHGFLLSGGKLTSIDYPAATFTGAYGISMAGDIVGRYTDPAGVTHGYVYSGANFTSLDIPGATSTGIDAINSVGDMVGRYSSNGITHGFVMNSPAVSYIITDLGTLPGGSFSQANQGNTGNGLVAGVSDTPSGNQHAALWQLGQTIDLAAQGLGGPNSAAYGLNENGVVVGQAETADSDPENFCGDGAGFRCVPFLWQNGIMSQLPSLGGQNGGVSTINSAGLIAGTAQTGQRDPSCPAPLFHDYEAVLWGPAAGQIRELRPLPGDTVGVGLWMNDQGQVVGTSGSCANTLAVGVVVGPHAVLWDTDGTPIDLGNLGGSVDVSLMAVGNRALYINNNGQVVGGSTLAGNKTAHAFLWTRDSGMKDLGVVAGDDNSGGLAINNRGEVVGVSNDKEGNARAFIWRNGLMTDLNALAPADSPLYLIFASGINDHGEIVGFGAAQTGDVHAFLATPNNAVAISKALGMERPVGLSDAVSRAFSRHFGKRAPMGLKR